MKTLFPILFLLLTCLTANAQEKTTAQKEVEQTVVSFFDAISALYFEKMKGYTKDIQFVEYGEVWDLNVLIDHLKPMLGKGVKRTNQLKFTKTIVYNNAAWVIYYNTADFLAVNGRKDHVDWLESVTLIKDKGKWKITLLHSTELPDKK